MLVKPWVCVIFFFIFTGYSTRQIHYLSSCHIPLCKSPVRRWLNSEPVRFPSLQLPRKLPKRKSRFKRSDGSTSSDTTSSFIKRQVSLSLAISFSWLGWYMNWFGTCLAHNFTHFCPMPRRMWKITRLNWKGIIDRSILHLVCWYDTCGKCWLVTGGQLKPLFSWRNLKYVYRPTQ